jgi:hypothetical protein
MREGKPAALTVQEPADPACRPLPAARPGPARRRPAWMALAGHPAVICVLVTALGVIVWIAVFPRVGTDLSAQIARAGWAARYPGAGYLFSWYGGIYPAGYSVLAPYVFAAAGVYPATAAAVLACAALLGLLLARYPVPRPRAAALWAAVALCTELSAGRATFTLGLAAALGCVAVVGSDRVAGRIKLPAAALLAVLTSLLSPVAGLFLEVPAAALLATGRRRAALSIGVAAAVPLAGMALLPGGGVQPFGVAAALPPLISAALLLLAVPRRWRVVRAGAVGYGLLVVVVLVLPTPVGSNVERLGELLAGLASTARIRQRCLFAAALAAAAVWQVAQPTVDLSHGNGPAYTPQTAALVRELRARHADTARLEAVPQYGHWESQQLADVVPLARGWERQADTMRNPLFYRGTLTPAAYHAWLRANAVRYVAISAARPDGAAVAEADLIRAGQPWLVPVWHNAFWALYRVAGTLPLASPPATVTGSTPAQITLRMSRPGRTVVRIRWSPLLRSTGGGTVSRHGAWTGLTATRAGVYTLSAPY